MTARPPARTGTEFRGPDPEVRCQKQECRRILVSFGVVLAAALLLTSCGDGKDDTGARTGEAVVAAGPSAGSATAEELDQVDLTPALLDARDFPDPDKVEPILLAGDFGAVGRGQRIKFCGRDLRAELGADRGRFSQFRVDRYAVTQTVTAIPEPEAAALAQRFAALGRECDRPWTQPDPNGGNITREVQGGFPIPDLGVDAAAYLVRGRNGLGQDDSVLLMAVDGPYVTTLTVTGPVGDRFQIVRPLELALGARLQALPRRGGAT